MKAHGLRHISGIFAACGALVPLVQAAMTDGVTEQDGRPTDVQGRDVSTLVDALGSADYAVRQAADDRLRMMDLDITPLLSTALDETDDFEKRLRIEHIAEHIYYWNRVLKFNGFLGISHTHYLRSSFTQPGMGDARVPAGSSAFYIERVIPDTSAERAGLQPGDLIVAVDGETVPLEASPTDFADRIRIKPPGTTMTFDLWRGNELTTREIRIGHRPPRYYRNATPELQVQWADAVNNFDQWWSSNFSIPAHVDPLQERFGHDVLRTFSYPTIELELLRPETDPRKRP